MKPFLYYHPEFAVPSFAFMLMIASLAATLVPYFLAKKNNKSQLYVLDLGIICTLAAIIGGRLFHVFIERWDYYSVHPSHIYQIHRGGFVSYGGFIGVAVSSFFYLRYRKVNILDYYDYMATYAFPFAILSVRVGCLLAGCCYGHPTNSALSLTFHTGDAALVYKGIALHPTQIYSMVAILIVFFALHQVKKRQKFYGQRLVVFLILYAIFRFLIEFFRADTERGLWFGDSISTAQIVSIVLVALCLPLYQWMSCNFQLQKTLK